MDVFYHIRGVPKRIVLDNAMGAGRRMSETVRLTQCSSGFQSHFSFEVTFCNPASGHGKRNVENKSAYVRRNYFVPLLSAPSILERNNDLFLMCDLDNLREHYKKDVPICELFVADRQVLLPLPHTAASLVTRHSESKRGGSLERTMTELGKADLVIIDEWSNLPMDREEAQLLLQVIAASYERRSLILTTNLGFQNGERSSQMTKWSRQ